uniref:Uncharacterized protein n=1 Tax=Meloidogyne javanica TaxID=6303 RepID=A0A915LTP1_MELJA
MYSGWSPDFVDYHIVVRVEYIKKSRSDNIVRPLLPLQDLFPVVCSSMNGAEDKNIVKVSQSEPLGHKLNVKETQLIEHLKACLLKCLDVNQAIQLYTEEVYDTETIVPKMLTNCENTVCNIDFYLCNKCADAALKYHKIYHLRYSIFKASEMKLELTSTENPEYSVEQVIEQCKNDTEWVENLCIEGANVILAK